MASEESDYCPGKIADPITDSTVSHPAILSPDVGAKFRISALPPACQKVLETSGFLGALIEVTELAGGLPGSDPDASPLLCQKLIEAYGRLDEQDRRRTAALAAAAHELRSPLQVIGGYAELLLSGKVGPLNPRQWRMLDDVLLHCKRLQQVVSDLLAYGAAEAGQKNIKFIVGDLNVCLSELYKFWLPRFKQKGVTFHFLPSEEMQISRFDYDKVQHIVSNLVENALKFTPPGGTVRLETELRFWERRNRDVPRASERRRNRSADQPNAVGVSVADTGPGIVPEHRGEIFDAFVKLPLAGNAPHAMGLGLAIARRLVQAHGGKVWVESAPESGAKFCVLLPVNPDLEILSVEQ